MTGKRRVGLGSVVVKQSGGGGAATASKQGGGNKLIGLISTKNMAINGAMVHNIRTRSDGGNSRHWFFCMNQLGGVGRRWGQAAGPGNRAGVSAGCAELARQSRLDHLRGWHGGGGVGRPGRDVPPHMNVTRAIAAFQAYVNNGTTNGLPTTVTASAATTFSKHSRTSGVNWDTQVMVSDGVAAGTTGYFGGACGDPGGDPSWWAVATRLLTIWQAAHGCAQSDDTTYNTVPIFSSPIITLRRKHHHLVETTVITIYDATF